MLPVSLSSRVQSSNQILVVRVAAEISKNRHFTQHCTPNRLCNVSFVQKSTYNSRRSLTLFTYHFQSPLILVGLINCRHYQTGHGTPKITATIQTALKCTTLGFDFF